MLSLALSLALATASPAVPAASFTPGAAIAVCSPPEGDCAAFAVRAIDHAESEIRLTPHHSAGSPIRARTCVLFWPKRFDAEGPALEFCMERYSTLSEVKGERDALLHYTPIQNRCEDHRLV